MAAAAPFAGEDMAAAVPSCPTLCLC